MINNLIGTSLLKRMSLIYAVNALREIGNQLGKKNWNFSVNPCDENDPNISNWNTTTNKKMPQYNNSVICNCSYPGGICHIESMYVFDFNIIYFQIL